MPTKRPSGSKQPSRTIDEIRELCSDLRQTYTLRDNMYEDLRKMFHMEWAEAPAGDWIKATMSPSAYNAVMGAMRMMVSTEPQINVPWDESDTMDKQTSETIEQACKAMWNGCGRVRQRPVHWDMILSAVLFGEICASVSRTQDLLDHATALKDVGQIARMNKVINTTPFMFEVYNPSTVYPQYDNFGLARVVRRVETRWAEVISAWGDAAANVVGQDKKTTDTVILNDYWDWECRAVWVDEANDPILFEPHGLKFLPFVCQITDGTSLFGMNPEQERLPMLYSVLKSDLWKRESLSLTTMFSLIHSIGTIPLLVHKSNDPNNPVRIDRTIPGGTVELETDESLVPLMEKVLDPSQQQGLQMASDLVEASTVNKLALGAAPNHMMSFSAVNLLTQSARLPLIGIQAGGSAAVANLLIAALEWYRDEGGKSTKFYADNKFVELDPADVGTRPIVKVSLDPDLPQDKLQMAQTGMAILNAGLASKRWVMENILQIGQAQNMLKEIWFERREEAEMQKRLAQVQAQAQMQMQQQAQQEQAQTAAQAQTTTPGQPGGIPLPPGSTPGAQGQGPEPGAAGAAAIEQGAAPVPSAMPPGGRVGPGMPLTAPLPPRGQQG